MIVLKGIVYQYCIKYYLEHVFISMCHYTNGYNNLPPTKICFLPLHYTVSKFNWANSISAIYCYKVHIFNRLIREHEESIKFTIICYLAAFYLYVAISFGLLYLGS